VRRLPLSLLAILSACGTFHPPVSNPRTVSPLSLVPQPKGACAIFVGDGSTEGWSRETGQASASLGRGPLPRSVEACARSREGAGGILGLELIFESGDDRWRPEFWHLEVVRKSGLVIYAGSLNKGTAEQGMCLVGVCNMDARTTVDFAEPWRADEYRIRLQHVPTGQRIELAITLEE